MMILRQVLKFGVFTGGFTDVLNIGHEDNESVRHQFWGVLKYLNVHRSKSFFSNKLSGFFRH